MESAHRQPRARRTLILCFGALMMLFSGLIYGWSIFVSPLEKAFGWNRGQTSFVFTLSMSVSILGQITGGSFVAKRRQRAILRVAAVLLAAGFGWASAITNLPALYLSYGVVAGFAVGICYNATLATVVAHFPDRVGFATGILLMSFGLGSLVLGSATTSLIVGFGWRLAFRALAASFGLVMLAGSFVLRPADGQASSSGSDADPAPRDMLREASYVKFFLWAVLMSGMGLLILGHAAPFAADLGAPMGLAGLSVGLISMFNGASRLLYGRIYDRRGYVPAMVLACSLYAAATAGLILAHLTGSLWILFPSYAVLGLAYGGGPVTVSTYVKERFGGRHYGTNLGITNLNIVIASFIGPLVAGILRARWQSYLPAFLLMAMFVAASFALIPRTRRK